MKSAFNISVGIALAALGSIASASGTAADAAHPKPQQALTARAWTEHTWQTQVSRGPRPAAYLFTASYCGSCVEAFHTLQQASKQSPVPVALIAILTDLSPAEAAPHASHFSGLTHLYGFDGFEPAIRQSVDPRWAQITPYVVLVDRRGQMQRLLGVPEPQALRAWLK